MEDDANFADELVWAIEDYVEAMIDRQVEGNTNNDVGYRRRKLYELLKQVDWKKLK